MIGKLKGIVDSRGDNAAIIDVGGVGYYVFCSGHTLRYIPEPGEAVSLIIETHVREDHIHLYGFSGTKERDAFILLTKVSGVGVKMAMAILSSLTPEQLALAIASEDKAAFKAISGIGPKLALRVITELKDKFFITAPAMEVTHKEGIKLRSVTPENNAMQDAVSALVNLGYHRSEAYSTISRIVTKNESVLPVDALIREGLKLLATG